MIIKLRAPLKAAEEPELPDIANDEIPSNEKYDVVATDEVPTSSNAPLSIDAAIPVVDITSTLASLCLLKPLVKPTRVIVKQDTLTYSWHDVVIADRLPSSRTVEELKDRYYSVSRALVRARAGSTADISKHPLIKL